MEVESDEVEVQRAERKKLVEGTKRIVVEELQLV